MIADALASACPPKGYLAHVLGFAQHAVLEAVLPSGGPGCADGALEKILPTVEAELFTDLAEEKEVWAVSAPFEMSTSVLSPGQEVGKGKGRCLRVRRGPDRMGRGEESGTSFSLQQEERDHEGEVDGMAPVVHGAR